MAWLQIKLLLIIALGCSGSAVYGGELRLQVLSPMQRVFFSTPVVEKIDATIELWAARNEYESAQVAVHADQEVTIDKVEATDLTNASSGKVIAAGNFSCRFPAYVFVEKHTGNTTDSELDGKAPGWFPDPFEESQKLTFKGARSLYLTWYVPPDTPPGDYQGELVIRFHSGSRRLPVLLHVWSFTLPPKPSLYVTNWFQLIELESKYQIKRGTGEFWRVVEQIARDMAAHRQNVIFTPLALIRSTEMPDGGYKFDFRDYEHWVAIFLKYDFQAFEGSHLFHSRYSYSIQRFIGTGTVEFGEKQLATPEGRKYLEKLLQALHQENQKLGIQDKYLQHIRDEASPEQVPQYRQIAALVRTVMPGIPIIDATSVPENQRRGMMDIPVTLMGKPVSNLSESGVSARWGKWWYTACDPKGRFPNRFIDYPLMKMRIIPWVSWRAGMSGYLHYGYNHWYTPSRKSPWQDVEQSGGYPPGDGFVVYPPRANRTGAPVSSLRWETWRDGLEDYEYLHLLERWTKPSAGGSMEGSDKALCQKFREQAATLLQEIRTAGSSPEEYPRDPRIVESLRRRMGAVLDQITTCTGRDLSRP